MLKTNGLCGKLSLLQIKYDSILTFIVKRSHVDKYDDSLRI